MKNLLRIALAGLAFLGILCRLHAFNVNPMVAEFDPNKPRSQQVFVLTNTTEKEKPIEVAVVKPRIDENGAEIMDIGVGEDQFLIVPQQFVLPPNSRRSVKVFYVGQPLNEEDTYRILFKELPVKLAEEDLPQGESTFNMSIVMQYYTRVWLTPSGLKEDLKVTSFDKFDMPAPASQSLPTEGDSPAESSPVPTIPVLRLTVANEGERHGYLRYPKFDLVTRDGKVFTLPDEAIQQISGQVVLRHSSKQFAVNWDDAFPDLANVTEIRLKTAKR